MRVPKFRIRTLMASVAIVALLLVLTRTISHRRDVQRRAEARYTAASQAYAEAELVYLNARIELDDLYSQSRMLLEAQRDIHDSAAAADHLKRMQKIQNVFMHLGCTMIVSKYKRSVVDLWVKEAELWVAKARW